LDHVLCGDESLRKKMEYVLDNPVRAGLVRQIEEYRWLWWDRELLAEAS
jgi:hypothetical protein